MMVFKSVILGILIFFSFAVWYTEGALLDGGCVVTGDCTADVANSVCFDDNGLMICRCEMGYIQSWNRSTCYTVGLGGDCVATIECTVGDPNSVCVYESGLVCRCDTGYFVNGTSCSAKKNLGDACDSTAECAPTNSECSTNCQCVSTHYQQNVTTCTAKIALGSSCTDSSQCAASNSMCNTNCECSNGYVESGTTCVSEDSSGKVYKVNPYVVMILLILTMFS